MVNCNQVHWTLLQHRASAAAATWLHRNSITGPRSHHGRRECENHQEVDEQILQSIAVEYGDYALHRVVPAVGDVGLFYLEAEGRLSQMEREQEEARAEADASSAGSPEPTGSHLKLITINVDGLGSYQTSAAERMQRIVKKILLSEPQIILFQEVTSDMYSAIRQYLPPGWRVWKKRDTTEDYFVATAVQETLATQPGSKISSFSFPSSTNGRHMLSVYFGAWAIANVHLESGGHARERDARAAQLQHLSRWHESSAKECRRCVIAGDFNLREGEDRTSAWYTRTRCE